MSLNYKNIIEFMHLRYKIRYNYHCCLNLHFWILGGSMLLISQVNYVSLRVKNVNINKCVFAEYVHQKIDWQINDKGCCY